MADTVRGDGGQGVAVPGDSEKHHWAVTDWEATMARHNPLAALGFHVLHVTPTQLRDRPSEVVSGLRTALFTGPHGQVNRVCIRG